MSDNENSSTLDNIIAAAMIMWLAYITFLAIPILPYFDVLLKIVLAIHTPDSILGGFIVGFIMAGIGIIMLEISKELGQKIFSNKKAMYLFLYGQGLILISLLAFLKMKFAMKFIISDKLIELISIGFNEPNRVGIFLFFITGMILLVISNLLENKTQEKNKKKIVDYHPKVKFNNQTKEYEKHDIANNVVLRNRLKIIKQSNDLLKKENPSAYEWSIIEKARKYREQFSTEEMENIDETIKYYKQWE